MIPEVKKQSLKIKKEYPLIIFDKKGRDNLSEGRQYQMGFAFLRPYSKNRYQAITPFSTCKDYLNDIIFTHNTGVRLSAYGLTTSLIQTKAAFKSGIGFLGITILPYITKLPVGHPCRIYNDEGVKIDKNRLKDNIQNITSLLNYVEKKLNVSGQTVVYEAVNDYYLFVVPAYWLQASNLISIYSLLIRMGQFYNGDCTPTEFLETYDNNLDLRLWKEYQLMFEGLVSGNFWVMDYPQMVKDYSIIISGTTIHNLGAKNSIDSPYLKKVNSKINNPN